MATGDFLDLAQAAVRAAQGATDDTDGDLARAKAAINEAHQTVCGDGYPYDFLEQEGQWTTTAGSDVYSYSSIATAMGLSGATIREIHMMCNDTDGFGGAALTSVDWQQVEAVADSSQEASEGSGTPVIWSKWGTRLRLYPNPDRVYTLGTYCFVFPAEMTADTDFPLIPAAYARRVLVPYAAALLLEQEGGAEAGADYERRMNRHREAVRDLRVAHATAKRPTFNVVTPTAFDHLPGSGLEWGYW